MTEPCRALVVIAKEPVPGAVKTRLAPLLGADGAARAAAAMLAAPKAPALPEFPDGGGAGRLAEALLRLAPDSA